MYNRFARIPVLAVDLVLIPFNYSYGYQVHGCSYAASWLPISRLDL